MDRCRDLHIAVPEILADFPDGAAGLGHVDRCGVAQDVQHPVFQACVFNGLGKALADRPARAST